MNDKSYLIPEAMHESEIEVKKSRFIARLCPASNRSEAMQALQLAKQAYPDARHHCWAYQIGPPSQPQLVAMSDDGEPSGTAGKPIFNVVQHKNVGNVMLIVVRYFGGIKLGAGGLVRAYSAATQNAYDLAQFKQIIFRQHVSLHCEFADEQVIRHWASQHDGEILSADYQQQVQLNIALPKAAIASLLALSEGLKGSTIEVEDSSTASTQP